MQNFQAEGGNLDTLNFGLRAFFNIHLTHDNTHLSTSFTDVNKYVVNFCDKKLDPSKKCQENKKQWECRKHYINSIGTCNISGRVCFTHSEIYSHIRRYMRFELSSMEMQCSTRLQCWRISMYIFLLLMVISNILFGALTQIIGRMVYSLICLSLLWCYFIHHKITSYSTSRTE